MKKITSAERRAEEGGGAYGPAESVFVKVRDEEVRDNNFSIFLATQMTIELL